MTNEEILEVQKKYNLTRNDFHVQKSKKTGKVMFKIITRTGIEKIQAQENIKVNFECIVAEPTFCVIKATSGDVQTYGSAKHGDFKNGNTETWYIAEMAEKRALSRIVLKVTNLYQNGFFGEDENSSFNGNKKPELTNEEKLEEIKRLFDIVPITNTGDSLYIERIIKEEEVTSYDKVINILNKLKQ